jgi:hypothetical protein
MEQLTLPLDMLENRFTICTRCGDDIYLANKATPEEDIARWRRHVCKKPKLQLVRTQA